MKSIRYIFLWVTIAFVLLTTVASATTTIFYDETNFLNYVNPGYYLEDFTALTGGNGVIANPTTFSGNGYSYEISATSYLYSLTNAVSTGYPTETLTVSNFTGTPATAVGGYFYPTDDPGNDTTGTIKVYVSVDGQTYTLTYASSSPRQFLGIVSTTAFGSLNITSDGVSFPSLDHLYVGSAVPIPPSALLLGSGLLGLLGLGWRRKSS
jgi:hypothetical protein